MLKRLALLLGAALLLFFAPPPSRASADPEQTAGDRPMYVGPTGILFADADSVYYVVSKEWLSASVRHQEKLLRRAVRMACPAKARRRCAAKASSPSRVG